MNRVEVHKHRTVTLPVSLGYDVSGDTFKSDIRVAKDPESELIAEWQVSFLTDGTDGELVLTLDDAATDDVPTVGYMDIKRTTGGEPVPVFNEILEVVFIDTVTV